MKNLNEPHKTDSDVIPFERRSAIEKGKEMTASLIPQSQVTDLRGRWTSIQSSFVDEPQQAVQDADNLVRLAIKQIEAGFSTERGELEKQWSRGEKVSTEDLRVCLQHYRQFFDRLLSRV